MRSLVICWLRDRTRAEKYTKEEKTKYTKKQCRSVRHAFTNNSEFIRKQKLTEGGKCHRIESEETLDGNRCSGEIHPVLIIKILHMI